MSSVEEKNAAAASRFVVQMHNAFIVQITTGNLRRGQAWMNALATVAPDLYDAVSGTDADCYYDDRKLDAFKRAVFGMGG